LEVITSSISSCRSCDAVFFTGSFPFVLFGADNAVSLLELMSSLELVLDGPRMTRRRRRVRGRTYAVAPPVDVASTGL
jgi:hypothetical protein